jgi:glycogen phosphorylase
VARQMVQGVDLWLNNPRRGEEACGTSGMKAALNGVLNLSILDGWFDEAYEESGGWAIGDRSEYSEQQSDLHANIIYSLLENEIAPLFYQKRDESSVPEEWVRRMRTSIRNLSPMFNCQRMVEEYDARFYVPAHEAAGKAASNSFAPARESSTWNSRLQRQWGYVRFLDTGNSPGSLNSGQNVNLRVVLDLAGLKPEDVSVEAVIGSVVADGSMQQTMIHRLQPNGREEHGIVFSGNFVPRRTGRLGIAYRVTQNHIDDSLTRPCGMLVKWA